MRRSFWRITILDICFQLSDVYQPAWTFSCTFFLLILPQIFYSFFIIFWFTPVPSSFWIKIYMSQLSFYPCFNVLCCFYQLHYLARSSSDPNDLGQQHDNCPYTIFSITLHNNQANFFTTSLHISWVIRSMETNQNRYGSLYTALSLISRVLQRFALNFNNATMDQYFSFHQISF